jgi:hypothetical protein
LITSASLYVEAQTSAEPVYVPEMSCTNGKFGMHLPRSYSELRQTRKVESEIADQPEDTHAGYSVIRRRINFPGLTLGVVTFSNDSSRYMTTYARVTSRKWRITGPFIVGQPIASTRRALGHAADDDPDLRNDYGSEGATVHFEHAHGALTSITYTCSIG